MRLALNALLAAFLVAAGTAASARAADAPPPVAPQPMPPAPAPTPAAVVLAGCGPCATAMPAPCGCGACLPACSRLTIEGHLSMLTPDPEGAPGRVRSTLPTAIDWSSLEYGLGFGGRVAYEWPVLCSWTARLGGTFWGSWKDDATVTGNLAATDVPGGAVNNSPTFAVPLRSEATLWDLSVGVWRPCAATSCWCAAWGLGLRYVSFHEESSYGFPVVGGIAAPVTTLTNLAAESTNTLLAAQLMARVGWCLNRAWDFTVDVAAFAGWRHVENEVVPTGFTAPTPTGGKVEDDKFGFGFEVELALRWKVCRSWSVRGGYGLLALFDQSRAYQLVDFSHTGNLNLGPATSEDTLLAHRLFVGVEFNF